MPSRAAEDLYKLVDFKTNNNYYILPLLFVDHSKDFMNIKKEYISFIGNAALSKGYKEFLEFVYIDSQINTNRKYQIASSYDIKNNLDHKFDSLINTGKLVINDNHPLTNEEINLAYVNSSCVWLGYKASTQSGVTCKAQMFGAPCIATRVGDFKNKLDESTCVFIDDTNCYEEIDNALKIIEQSMEQYVYHARKAYLENYDYQSYRDLFLKLIKDI